MTKDSSSSLGSKQSAGGVNGGKGYDAQKIYACLKLPFWMLDNEFSHVALEQKEDVNAYYLRSGKIERHLFQVKDQDISLGEVKKIVRRFVDQNTQHPQEVKRFTIVAKSFPKSIAPLRNLIKTFLEIRNSFPVEEEGTGRDTYDHLLRIFTNMKLPGNLDFWLEKVYLEDDQRIAVWPNNLDTTMNEFVGSFLKLPAYHKIASPALFNAFDELLGLLTRKTRADIPVDEVKRLIDGQLAKFYDDISQRGVSIFADHWGNPTYTANFRHDYVLAWREYFNRDLNIVPNPSLYSSELLPELLSIEAEVYKNQPGRHICIRGTGALTTGMVLGSIFSEAKNYSTELSQLNEIWYSTCSASSDKIFKPDAQFVPEDLDGDGLCLMINAGGSVSAAVEEYRKISGMRFRGRLELSLEVEQLRFDNAKAVKAAREIKDFLRKILIEHKIQRTHVFYLGTFGLAVFMGQLWNRLGEFQLYEYNNKQWTYMPTALLDTQ
jgi:hypothetical protein